MKLPETVFCLLKTVRGNNKKQTKLVEGRWIGFRTGVRFPSGPLEAEQTNRYPSFILAVLKFSFCMIFEAKILEMFDVERLDITFSTIRDWIQKKYGVIVSNSSISQVKEKCGIDEFKLDMKLECECENLTEKEQYVLMALKHFKVIK